MEEIEHILRNFGLILGAGLVSQLIATVIRLPQMVVLVSAGTLIGPSVLGLVSNPLSGVGAQLLFNIQRVALILTQVRHACTTGEVTLSWYRLSARIMRYGSTTLKSAVGTTLPALVCRSSLRSSRADSCRSAARQFHA